MDTTDFQPDLAEQLEQAERQKIYVLSGERGLGKHSALDAVEKTLKAAGSAPNVISIHPDEFSFSLWPVEDALRRAAPCIALPSQGMQAGLNYTEQLMRSFIELCSGQTRTLIFLHRIHAFNNDLWAFTARLFRLLLEPYRNINVCFCCCLHTNIGTQSEATVQLRSTDQIIELFARHALNTTYLNFLPWPKEALRHFLQQELFGGKLRMGPGQENLLLEAVMGSPATLVSLTERMKIRGLLYQKDGWYCCGDIDGSILLTCGSVPAKEQYERLDTPLKELLRGSSMIGVEFESKLLSNPLEFFAVEDKLKQLQAISRIVLQKVDDLYEFESVFARLSIRDFVSNAECVLWNGRLGDYFWRLSQRESAEGAVSASLNSLKKSAFYYDEAANYTQAAELYSRLVIKLMAIMQYMDAVVVLHRIRTLCEACPSLRTPEYLNRTWQLEGDCYRYRSEFSKAAAAYETFLTRAHLTRYERFDARCGYCVVLYESGEIHRPFKLLRQLLHELEQDSKAQVALTLVRTLSCLSSIEETLCNPDHEYHFNAALDIANRYQLADEYYVLLRKSLIVHKGIYGIRLMESARAYFERVGNQKELAKVLSNISAELLLHGDLEQARAYYEQSAELLRSFGGETIYVPLNGLGDYWCLRGEFERALPLFEAAFHEECDMFSQIAILLNQATACRKLGRYADADKRLKRAEQISNTGDASEYAILLPHLLIGKALLLYDTGDLDAAYALFLQYIREDPHFGRRRPVLAAQYIQKICLQLGRAVPEEIGAAAQISSPADERILRYGITLIRFSITE